MGSGTRNPEPGISQEIALRQEKPFFFIFCQILMIFPSFFAKILAQFEESVEPARVQLEARRREISMPAEVLYRFLHRLGPTF